MTYVFLILMLLTAIFLILLVLIQRGKGGGLAGAFGGMGGQSAFGTKAGDTFTRITIGVAAFWILLCILGVRMFRAEADLLQLPGAPNDGLIPARSAEDTGTTAPVDAAGDESGTPSSGEAPTGDGS